MSSGKKAAAVPAAEKKAEVNTGLPAKWGMTYDVVVVGGAFAGLAASHSAATHGAKTVKIYREGAFTGKVVGIGVETKDGYKTIKAAKAVILATGEGIAIAQEIGANTIQMSCIQLYPFDDPNNGVLDSFSVIPFSGPSAGVVYVDAKGKRYVNEGERRDVCANGYIAGQMAAVGTLPDFIIGK